MVKGIIEIQASGYRTQCGARTAVLVPLETANRQQKSGRRDIWQHRPRFLARSSGYKRDQRVVAKCGYLPIYDCGYLRVVTEQAIVKAIVTVNDPRGPLLWRVIKKKLSEIMCSRIIQVELVQWRPARSGTKHLPGALCNPLSLQIHRARSRLDQIYEVSPTYQ